MENRVDPDKITWVVSRDAWLLDRKNTQPSVEFFDYSIGTLAAQFEAVAAASSIPDLFERLEEAGVLVRIDKNVQPKMFHGATISQMELEEMRRIKNVVRKGRVQRIEKDQIVFKHGTIPTSTEQVHIDCSASAITNFEIKPVFQGDLIIPQTVRPYQPVFSAAFVAHVEAAYDNEKKKNELCTVVPLPNHDTDWIRMLAVQMMNQFNWSQDKDLRNWLINNRLNGFSKLMRSISKEDVEKQAVIQRMRDSTMPAAMKLQQFLAELD